MIRPQPLIHLSSTLHRLVEGKLWVKVLIGMLLGIGYGLLMGQDVGWVERSTAEWITQWTALPGNIFLRLLQMIMIPLIISSIIQGIAGGENAEQLKKTGLQVGLYFIVTTLLSVLIGWVLSVWVLSFDRLEADVVENSAILSETSTGSVKSITIWISDIIPSNPLQAMLQGEMLSLVLFAIIIGIAVLQLDRVSAQAVLRLVSAIQEICMIIIGWAMKLAPFAVFGLIGQIVAKTGFGALTQLLWYVFTVLLGLSVLMVLYLSLLWVRAGISPISFFSKTKDLLLLAFSMASSAAVMPLSIKTLEEQFGVNSSFSRFIIPVGATVNMNGTALYQMVATLYIAHWYQVDLSVPALLLVVVTTVSASIGTPSTPGAAVIILGTILSSAGIPMEGISMIIGVDAILGMARTVVNVTGDLTATLLFSANSRDSKPTTS